MAWGAVSNWRIASGAFANFATGHMLRPDSNRHTHKGYPSLRSNSPLRRTTLITILQQGGMEHNGDGWRPDASIPPSP